MVLSRKVIDAVIDGKATHFTKKNKTVHLMKNGIEAVLSLDEHGNTKTLLLTGWDTSISKDAERPICANIKTAQSWVIGCWAWHLHNFQ